MVAEDASNGIYPAFFSNKLSGKDSPILQADGFLYYDKVKKQYIVGSKEKIRQPKLNGQLINLSVNSCDINCDGKLNFNVDYGMLTMNSVGQLKFSASDSSVTAKTVTLFNFPMNEDIQKHIGEKIITNEGLTPIDVSKTLFEKSLVEILGTEKSDKVITDMALDGSIKRFPEEFQTSIFFSDLNWKWNAEHGTLVAVGNLGIGGMGKKQAFKYVKGVVEIQQKKTGDILTIYLEVSSADYYLIEYKGGVMTISTPDAKVGEIYANLKDSDRVFEDGKKRFSFNYVSSAKKKIDALIEKYPELEK
jgi:hypothetical protein